MIAISYRREDSLPIAGRLYDRLQAQFGKQNVFMDFDSIPGGVDFPEHIKQTIEQSELVVAVIGPRWLGEQSDSSRRIDEPTDFVRLEIKYALERGIPVIPLLVDNTPMPKPAELPPEIERLAFRNALPLHSGIDFHNHADRLINGISGLVAGSERLGADASAANAEAKRSGQQRSKRTRLLVAAGVLAGLAAIAGGFWGVFQDDKGRTVSSPLGTTPVAEKSAPLAQTPEGKAGPIYKGTIRAQGDSGSGTPLTINLADDRKSGTMTQTTRSGDTVVKFNGVWEGTTLRAVTDAVVSKPNNIQWKPESFTLRFTEDWQRGSYECDSEGNLYTAELTPP